MPDALELARYRFADELAATAPIRDLAVRQAFATVPRERFLGPGPWTLVGDAGPLGEPVSDPAQLYRDVLVVIDVKRGLNNGEPKLWARLFDRLGVRAGERVAHVGTGTGYYTAILAELVGQEGHVVGIEVDEDLAARTRENLQLWPQVEAHAGNGFEADLGSVDVVVASAGMSHPPGRWLDALTDGGRLLVPMTVHRARQISSERGKVEVGGWGAMLLVTRQGQGFAAEFVCPVGFYPCLGGRTPEAEERLRAALNGGGQERVRSLHRHPDVPDETCWLHADEWWLSTREPPHA